MILRLFHSKLNFPVNRRRYGWNARALNRDETAGGVCLFHDSRQPADDSNKTEQVRVGEGGHGKTFHSVDLPDC